MITANRQKLRHFGDYQTPILLVQEILKFLAERGVSYVRVLEPTCGEGSFISALISETEPPAEIQAVEIHEPYVEAVRALANSAKSETRLVVRHANVFDLNLGSDIDWKTAGPLLVIGNPPWVTNSEMGGLGESNMPRKTNFKNLPGFEAMTGASNFDIAESIVLKVIRELVSEAPTVALLCKTVVARNVLEFAAKARLPVSGATIRRVDAKRHFGAAVDACLFTFDVRQPVSYHADVYESIGASVAQSRMGVLNGILVSNLQAYEGGKRVDGISPLSWRQGLKHDAASVMEGTLVGDGLFESKSGERVELESEYIFPLLKSSDLFRELCARPSRAVIVPQTRLGTNTEDLGSRAPHLGRYLERHRATFDARRSSIYRNRSPFAIFGIGDYSFASYKVAISGFHADARFRVVGPVNGRPVMFDDTCYFAPCDSAMHAALIAALLEDRECLQLLSALVDSRAKRPITVKILRRINVLAVLDHADRDSLLARASVHLDCLVPKGLIREWPDDLSDIMRVNTTDQRQRSLWDAHDPHMDAENEVPS